MVYPYPSRRSRDELVGAIPEYQQFEQLQQLQYERQPEQQQQREQREWGVSRIL